MLRAWNIAAVGLWAVTALIACFWLSVVLPKLGDLASYENGIQVGRERRQELADQKRELLELCAKRTGELEKAEAMLKVVEERARLASYGHQEALAELARVTNNYQVFRERYARWYAEWISRNPRPDPVRVEFFMEEKP